MSPRKANLKKLRSTCDIPVESTRESACAPYIHVCQIVHIPCAALVPGTAADFILTAKCRRRPALLRGVILTAPTEREQWRCRVRNRRGEPWSAGPRVWFAVRSGHLPQVGLSQWPPLRRRCPCWDITPCCGTLAPKPHCVNSIGPPFGMQSTCVRT